MGGKVSGVQLFWTVVAGLIYLWACIWVGIRETQRNERAIQEINKTRPAHRQFPGGGIGLNPLQQCELLRAMREHDPSGFRRSLLEFVAVMLLGLALSVWINHLARAA